MATPAAGYRLKDGSRVPGTTTIIGRFKESGALLHWAFAQGKLAEQGKIRHLYDKRDEAADFGTQVHELIEAHKNGQAITLPDDAPEQVRSGVEAYLSWERMTKLEIVQQEVQLVCDCHRFGGTPDAIGRIDGKLCLLDWKTSNGVYSDYLIQLAAYKHLIERGYRLDNGEPLGLTLDGGFHLCRFSKSHGDFAHHYYPKLDEAWSQFVLFREAYEIDKQLKKRAA